MSNAATAQGRRSGMPEMPNQVGDREQHAAEALAGWSRSLPTQRNAAEGRVMRALYVAWDAALVFAFCTAVFWIAREVMVIWGS